MSPFAGRVLLPLIESLQGRHFRSILDDLVRLQYLPYEELRARQEQKLRRLIDHAHNHVPFYRERLETLGLKPSDIRSLEDLAHLPVLTREDVRRNFPARITADNIASRRGRLDRTSGSTGVPLEFIRDRAGRDACLASFLLFDSWAGIRPGERTAHIGGPQPRSFRSWLFDKLRSRHSFSVFEMSAGKTDRVLDRLVRLKPSLVEGYASAIHQLAQAALRIGRGPRPKAVVTTSDTLPSREIIERAFGCPVFDRYGNREICGALAQDCPSGEGLHINTELCLVEIVDDKGRPVPRGQRGRVLLTDLTNEVMPFIRYDSGDLAVAGGRCSCGRGFPLLGRVEGRSSECLTLPGGRLLSPVAFSHYLFVSRGYTEHVLKYQAEQTGPGSLTFRFVPVGKVSESLIRRLRADLAELLGPNVTIDIQAVENIPLEPGGKQAVLKLFQSKKAGQT